MKDENELLQEAYELYQAGMPGACLAVCEEIIAQEVHPAQAHYYAGLACIHLGRIDQAVAEIKEAMRHEPSNAYFYLALATAYSDNPFQRGRQGREQVLREAILLMTYATPEWVRQVTRGMLAGAEGDWNLALSCYLLALPDAPNPEFVHAKIGHALYHLGRWEEARDVMRDVVSHQTQDPTAWLFLGRIEWKMGSRESAVDAFEQAAALDPYNRLTLLRLAQVNFTRGQWLPGFRHIRACWRIIYQTAVQEEAAMKKSAPKKSTPKG